MTGKRVGSLVAGALLAGALAGRLSQEGHAAAAPAGQPSIVGTSPKARQDLPPRKTIIGTSVQGFWGAYPGLDKRVDQLRELVDEMAAQVAEKYPGRTLDLAVL